MAAILMVLLAFRRQKSTGYRRQFLAWWGIVGVSGALFLLCGIISSALEIFFTVSTAFLVRSLWHSGKSLRGS